MVLLLLMVRAVSNGIIPLEVAHDTYELTLIILITFHTTSITYMTPISNRITHFYYTLFRERKTKRQYRRVHH